MLLTSFGIVFVTELLGDKTLFSLCALATRHRPLPVFIGTLAAFMIKMAAAVMLGRVLAHLDARVISVISGLTLFTLAIWLYRREPEKASETAETTWPRTALIACSAILFTEWGDAGQIAAATLSARYGHPGMVWIGATLAIATKGALAITLGMGLRHKVPLRVLRYAGVAVCVLMGILSFCRIEI